MGISTCYRVLRQLTRLVLLGSIVIFSLIFGPQITKFGLRASTSKKIKVKKYEAIILQKGELLECKNLDASIDSLGPSSVENKILLEVLNFHSKGN